MTGTEPIEVRAHKPGAIAHRTLPAAEVEAEVTFLAGTGKYHTIDVRAVGADTHIIVWKG